MIGDWSSLLTLLDCPPIAHCPAISPDSLVLLMRYKRGLKGTPLLNPNGHPVLNLNGEAILCAGGWSADTITQFQAAVSVNHIARGNSGAYQEKCAACISIFNDPIQTPNKLAFNGCMNHLGIKII